MVSDKTELVIMSISDVALPEVIRDILRAHDIGEVHQSFRRTRLEEHPLKDKFSDKMSKANLKTLFIS